MPASDTEYRIAKWLQSLRDLTVTGADGVTPERIATMAHMLAMDGLPGEAFTSGSLHAAAQGQRFFPAYDDVRRAVTIWWEANRQPSQPQIAGPNTSGLDAVDRGWVAFYRKRRAELAAADGALQADRAALANLASLVRGQSPRAWAEVSGERPLVSRAPTESEVSHVAKLLRPEPAAGQRRYEVVEAPLPFRDVTAKGDDLDRMRGKVVPQRAVVTDRGEWA